MSSSSASAMASLWSRQRSWLDTASMLRAVQ
jgi:hypothetical protein